MTYLGRLNYQQAPGLLCAEAAAGWLQVPDSSSCQVPVALRCGTAALLHVSGFVNSFLIFLFLVCFYTMVVGLY